MKKIVILVLSLLLAPSLSSKNYCLNPVYNYTDYQPQASIKFINKSDYTLTLKILYANGGLYSTVVLGPQTYKIKTFGQSDSFKLKIKAEHYGIASYHDGGNFSVICTRTEWTDGEMSFSLSRYGNGLGPSISAKEFESNY